MKTIALAALCLIWGATIAQADIWVVDQSGSGDFTRIQEAIGAATAGDEIRVHEGTYVENIDYLGKDLWLHSVDGPDDTIIDGSQGIPDSLTCVTFQSGETRAAILEGFTVTGGEGKQYLGNAKGGGVFCIDSSPIVRTCVFVDNQADYAAAIYVNSAHPEIVDCEFWDNLAVHYGGAIAGAHSAPSIQGCHFEDNMAGSADGTIHIQGKAHIEDCTFIHNWARAGAAINAPDIESGFHIVDCVFVDNTLMELTAGRFVFTRPRSRSPVVCSLETGPHRVAGRSTCWTVPRRTSPRARSMGIVRGSTAATSVCAPRPSHL